MYRLLMRKVVSTPPQTSCMCVYRPVIEFLQQIGPQSRPRPPSNGMTKDKSLQKQNSYLLLTVQSCSYSMCHVCRKLTVNSTDAES